MAIVAKSAITLSSVSDAYSAQLSATTCVINADYDGSNPDLSQAYTDITVLCGDAQEPITIYQSEVTCTPSSDLLAYSLIKVDDYKYRLTLVEIPKSLESGCIVIPVHFGNNTQLSVRFSFTVIRATTMLDWILDWNSNKTTLGDSYVITPKLFVGKKITGNHSSLSDVDGLTGVYIGPSENDGAGIYGYESNQEIFRIDETGGMIGGWTILESGIQSPDGVLTISSEGGISAKKGGKTYWSLSQDGSATFANGNIRCLPNGSAEFTGSITAKSGIIGGWDITDESLWSAHVILNTANQYIAVTNEDIEGYSNPDALSTVKQSGGVAMYYTNETDYGIIGYSGSTKAFSVGSENIIAGWSFDDSAMWIGTCKNKVSSYTKDSDSITIGTNGLRGNTWYIDKNGTASFAKGNVVFTSDNSTIAGWNINENSIYSERAIITARDSYCGIFFSTQKYDNTSANPTETVAKNGGFYVYCYENNTMMKIYDKNQNTVFYVSSHGTNSIGCWSFSPNSIYKKEETLSGFTNADGAITLSSYGLRGKAWRLEPDGSGAIAAGNIVWDSAGNVTFADKVKVYWEQGVTASQIMAFGQMLNRDPEFTTNNFNSTDLYLTSTSLSFSVAEYKSMLQSDGLLLKGVGSITQISIEGSDEILWSETESLTTEEAIQFVDASDFENLNDSDTICIIVLSNTPIVYMMKGEETVCLYGAKGSIGSIKQAAYRELSDDTDAPNSTHKVMQIVSNKWYDIDDLRLSGFAFNTEAKANGIFLARIVAKIPVGWQIENYHNAYGYGGKTEWLTSQSGTGTYSEYLCLVTCGATGTFDTINFFALTCDDGYTAISNDQRIILVQRDGNEVESIEQVQWRVAYCTVYDATSSDKVTTTIDKNGIYTGTLRADQIVTGTISSEFINTKDLIVQHILAGDSDGKHVEIDPESQSVAIYDEDGTLGTSLSGDIYSGGAEELYKDTVKGAPDLSVKNASSLSMKSGTFSNVDTLGTQTKLPTVYSSVWHSDSPICLTFNAGKVALVAFSAAYMENKTTNEMVPEASEGVSYAEAYVSFSLEVADDISFTENVKSYSIWAKHVSASSSALEADANGAHISVMSSNISTSSLASESLLNTRSAKSQYKGYYRIRMDGYTTAKQVGSYAKITWGSEYSGGDDLAATYINEYYVSRYFANGFCLGISSAQYVTAYKDANNKMVFKSEESGYGLMMSSQGLHYKHHSGNWMKMPLLVWKGKLTYDSSSETPYKADRHLSFDGKNFAAVARTTNSNDSNISKGHIHVVMTYPDAWTTLKLSVYNSIVNITGYGDSMMKGTLVAVSDTSIIVEISDDASSNDGELLIELYTIG